MDGTALVKLRSYHPSDLETLAAIDRVCFPPGIAYSREEIEGFIAQPNSETWVAVEGEQVIGFVIADRDEKEAGHVMTIDVVEGWRGQGVGAKLMGAAERWAEDQGLKVMYLETAEDNLGAQGFYQARGYKKLDKINDYYANGAAAWVMVKDLK